MYEGTEEFFKKYQARAGAEGVDALGYYLGGWGYAYIQVLGDAVKGANSLKDDVLADYIRKTTFKTIHGPSSSAPTANGRRAACCRCSTTASSRVTASMCSAA